MAPASCSPFGAITTVSDLCAPAGCGAAKTIALAAIDTVCAPKRRPPGSPSPPGGQPTLPPAQLFPSANRFAVWDLMRAIEDNRQPVSNIYSARLTVEMIQAIYASALSRSVVTFPMVDRRHPLTAESEREV